jgi:hypothetical protein
MVPNRIETGTTPSTINALDSSSFSMFAALNASRKLPHCGSLGQDSPSG